MRIQEFLNEVTYQQGVAEGSVTKKPQPYNDPDWAKKLPKEKLDAIAGPRYKKDKKEQGVAEERTEVKDKQGKVVSWKDDSEWHPAKKNKQGQPKDPRGVVTHLSDVARRKTAAQQGLAKEELNELDMFAPVTTFIKMTDGSYVQADWRRGQFNAGLEDSASFINFKPVNPTVAKQLGLDSHQRTNAVRSMSDYRNGTIAHGGDYQRSGPLATRGYEVVDYNKPESMEELPPEVKPALIKWVQKQGQGMAEGEGNFAGDTPVNIGGATVKRLGVGDTVTYFGRRAKIIGMSKTGNTSRIAIANNMGGITQDVLTSDLKRASQ